MTFAIPFAIAGTGYGLIGFLVIIVRVQVRASGAHSPICRPTRVARWANRRQEDGREAETRVTPSKTGTASNSTRPRRT
jgi:hypothetical protein